jgi:hypothetical protein
VTTLTAAHLFVTALGLDAATKCLRLFDAKSLEMKCVVARAALRCRCHHSRALDPCHAGALTRARARAPRQAAPAVRGDQRAERGVP